LLLARSEFMSTRRVFGIDPTANEIGGVA
jgi:hypothetical protein